MALLTSWQLSLGAILRPGLSLRGSCQQGPASCPGSPCLSSRGPSRMLPSSDCRLCLACSWAMPRSCHQGPQSYGQHTVGHAFLLHAQAGPAASPVPKSLSRLGHWPHFLSSSPAMPPFPPSAMVPAGPPRPSCPLTLPQGAARHSTALPSPPPLLLSKGPVPTVACDSHMVGPCSLLPLVASTPGLYPLETLPRRAGLWRTLRDPFATSPNFTHVPEHPGTIKVQSQNMLPIALGAA